jgi:hypothetical protein
MIGIYSDSFLDDLKSLFGDENIKIKSHNLIVPCPWCEVGQKKEHYHLYISLEIPIFNCFHAGCKEGHGFIGKFVKKLLGFDGTDRYVDKNNIKEILKKTSVVKPSHQPKRFIIPELNTQKFSLKDMYIRKRLKLADMPTTSIKGLIYDIEEFIKINNLNYSESPFQDFHFLRVKDFLQSNFIGFLTENHSKIIFRNIQPGSSFSHHKVKIFDVPFIDYYKLPGGNRESNKVVVAEGIFDIFSEQNNDYLNIDNDVRLYASALSSKYGSLLKSIVYYEQVFQLDVVVLSDRDVKPGYYEFIKKKFGHIINTMTVYYNQFGKDFNETPVSPIRLL